MKRIWVLVERSIGSWTATVGVDLGAWSVGFGWDLRPAYLWVEVGPLYCELCRDESWPLRLHEIPNWTLCLGRWVGGKLEVRFEIDWNIWRLGVSVADVRDWGIYAGPANIQFEFGKRYAENR